MYTNTSELETTIQAVPIRIRTAPRYVIHLEFSIMKDAGRTRLPDSIIAIPVEYP